MRRGRHHSSAQRSSARRAQGRGKIRGTERDDVGHLSLGVAIGFVGDDRRDALDPRLIALRKDYGRYEVTRRPQRRRADLLSMGVLVTGLVFLVVYGTISVMAQDPLWFVKDFDAQPTCIVVYHHRGTRSELQPGQLEFEALAGAIQASLTEGVVRPVSIGFSDASLQDVHNRFVTVEAFFAQPVKLHAPFDTGTPTQMLFPITGRHAEMSVVLLGQGDGYQSNPPVLKTMEPIRETLQALGYYE